jgi:hypothetical protein
VRPQTGGIEVVTDQISGLHDVVVDKDESADTASGQTGRDF